MALTLKNSYNYKSTPVPSFMLLSKSAQSIHISALLETHNGHICMYAFSPMRSQNGLDTYYGTNSTADLFIEKRLLLLSADVELNPGPTNEDTELLSNAIKTRENKLLGEIRSIKDDIAIIKTEIATVKEECVKTKLDFNKVKYEQLQTKQSIICMNKNRCLTFGSKCSLTSTN